MRIESDFIGERELDPEVLYGIHSMRARENFPDRTPFFIEWYKAIGLTKLACYNTYRKFKQAALDYAHANEHGPVLSFIDDRVFTCMETSAREIGEGKHYQHFIVSAIQGGAGTSTNMNVNEIIANRSLQLLGHVPGEYTIVDPLEQANVGTSKCISIDK
jgi:aspartate ammonia-lyase